MQKDERDLLDVLKFELNFLEKGGYGRSVRTPWRPQFIFEDSPTCANYDNDAEHRIQCSDCVLMQLVPPEGWSKDIPCRHIPFNEAGETLETLYAHDDQYETEAVVGKWLRETIAKLEADRENRKRQGSVHPVPAVTEERGVPLHQNAHPKCANPACPTAFHWLIGGKFFRFSEPLCQDCAAKSADSPTGNHHCVRHFWLCEKCSSIFTLEYKPGPGVMLKLKWTELPNEETHKMIAH